MDVSADRVLQALRKNPDLLWESCLLAAKTKLAGPWDGSGSFHYRSSLATVHHVEGTFRNKPQAAHVRRFNENGNVGWVWQVDCFDPKEPHTGVEDTLADAQAEVDTLLLLDGYLLAEGTQKTKEPEVRWLRGWDNSKKEDWFRTDDFNHTWLTVNQKTDTRWHYWLKNSRTSFTGTSGSRDTLPDALEVADHIAKEAGWHFNQSQKLSLWQEDGAKSRRRDDKDHTIALVRQLVPGTDWIWEIEGIRKGRADTRHSAMFAANAYLMGAGWTL